MILLTPFKQVLVMLESLVLADSLVLKIFLLDNLRRVLLFTRVLFFTSACWGKSDGNSAREGRKPNLEICIRNGIG